jgi:ACS family tartrate transporter-like MFS transporter
VTAEAIVARKMMLRLAPLILLLYLLFAIDRGNIGFAGLQMRQALNLSAAVFGIGSALFTVGYLVFQIPNTVWLRRLGGGRAFAAIACAWGLISALTAFVPDTAWFYANRLLLGVAEAGFNAFVIFYINRMFPRTVRGFAVGLTLLAVPLSMIVASPLSGWMLDWQWGALSGWQLMFIMQGVPSVLAGLVCWRLIPAAPSQIRFLNTEEKHWLALELEEGPPTPQGMAQSTVDALGNLVVWALGFVLFTTVFAVNVMLVWMPQMIGQVSGAGNVGVGVINSLPWIALGIGCLAMSRVSDRLPNRKMALLPSLGIAAAGFLAAAALQNTHPMAAFCGFALGAFGAGAAQGVFWALAMELLPAGAATAYAVISLLGNGSGLFAHPIIGRLHDATGSYAGVAWALGVFNLAAIATAALIAGHASTSPHAAHSARKSSAQRHTRIHP